MKKRTTLPKNFQELLDKGNMEELKEVFLKCDVNANNGNYTANAFAMAPLPREFAFWLKEHGGDINKKDNYDKSPIFAHSTYYNGDVSLVIELGGNPKETTKDCETPLHFAATYGRPAAVKALIENGADVNAKEKPRFNDNNYTPMERALVENRIQLETLLEICTMLLEAGAEITKIAKDSIAKIGNQFEFAKGGYKDIGMKKRQETALKSLYKLFSVEPVQAIEKHDGNSPIIIEEIGFAKQYNKLWEYLVPSSGAAKTAQGEIIRITGRISHEILDNGGANWDKDFKKMLTMLPIYFKMGNSLSDADMQKTEKLVKDISDKMDFDAPRMLTEYAVKWVLTNPTVIAAIPPNYKR